MIFISMSSDTRIKQTKQKKNRFSKENIVLAFFFNLVKNSCVESFQRMLYQKYHIFAYFPEKQLSIADELQMKI